MGGGDLGDGEEEEGGGHFGGCVFSLHVGNYFTDVNVRGSEGRMRKGRRPEKIYCLWNKEIASISRTRDRSLFISTSSS